MFRAALMGGTLLGICLPARSEPSAQERAWNARMNACVTLLRDSDKTLRNNWQGHCATTEFTSGSTAAAAERLRNLFIDRTPIELENSSSCRNSTTPIATTSKCGLGSRQIDVDLLSRASVRIQLPGNRCGSFIPVLLTNKTDFACNAIRSRIACLDVSYDSQAKRTTITFFTRRGGGADTTTINFGSEEFDKHEGRIGELINHPQFTIIPDLSRSGSVSKELIEATRAQERACIESGRLSRAACSKQAMLYADAKLQEAVRRYRNPRHDSPRDAIAQDGARIIEFLRFNKIDQIEEQWVLFLAIAANEVGLKLNDDKVSIPEPIYGLSDAVDANSGLTFGAHQIDLGASADRERRLFWDVIDAYKTAHPDSVLEKAAITRNCLDLPLRLMTVDALALTYRSAPRMTIALRSAEGVDSYNRRLLSYLADEVRITAAKSGLLKNSMIMRVLFSDVKNQVGTGAAVETFAEQLLSDGVDPSSCMSIVAAEDKILENLIWNNPADRLQGKTQYAYRYENIQAIVRSRAAHGGVSGCS
jgi:hypothetical protein